MSWLKWAVNPVIRLVNKRAMISLAVQGVANKKIS